MTIRTEQYSIKALFEQKQTFIVPKYQRGYAWDDEAVSDFIKDISECLEARLANPDGPGKHHFFGGLVTVRKEASESTRENYEIIDGQQRLGSFVILVTAIVKHIRDTIEELEKKPSLNQDEKEALAYLQETTASVERVYLTFRDNQGIKYSNVPKLTLSRVDKVFFENLVSGQIRDKIERESHRRIAQAWELLCEFVLSRLVDGSFGVSEKAMRIQLFLDGVLGKDCTVIFMLSGARAEAYQIFQVLNDRGVHLGKGDLLRSRTLELLDDPQLESTQDKVAGNWDDMLAYTPKAIDDYLLWYFSSMEGRRPRPVELAEAFLEHRFKCNDQDPVSKEGAKLILEETELMNLSFFVLNKMNDGDWPYPDYTGVTIWDRERIRMLVMHLKHTNAMPLLLSLTLLSAKRFAEAVASIERFVFRYKTIVNAHVTPMTNVYLKHAKMIRDAPGKYKIRNLRDDLSDLIDERAPDSLFKTGVHEIKFSPRGNNTFIRYFLMTIEDYTKWFEAGAQGTPKYKNKAQMFDFTRMTIEHIYPQQIEGEIKDNDLESIKHTLGNLTILSQEENDALANNPPEAKLKALSQSRLKMNRNISENDSWTKAEVNKRTEALAEMALKIFVP